MSDTPIVITGGTGGLGQTVVARLIGEYRCIVPYHSAGSWQALRFAIGADDRLYGEQVDVTDSAAMERFAESIRAQFGPIYGLVHLAGGWSSGAVRDTSIDDWNTQIALNLTGTFVAIHAFLPQLTERGSGRIITTGSAAALSRPGGMIGYTVSKLGVEVLTEALAKELKQTRVTANVIHPGSMATPAMRGSESADRLVPLERVADTIAWLLSDAAASVTGARIPITVTGSA